MLFNAGGNGKYVRVKNNVFRRKAQFVNQDAVGTFTNFNFALIGVGLAFFVKRHYDCSGAIALEQFGLLLKNVHPFFHRDGIDDALALNAAQTGFDHAPLGAVDHDGHTGNVWLAGDQV